MRFIFQAPYASAKRKHRIRSHSEVNDAAGFQRIGAVLRCPDLDHYSFDIDLRGDPRAEMRRV